LPYVPRIVIRQDLAVTPTLGTVYGRPLTTRLGTALTGVVDRPQPYGTYGHNIFLVDVLGELRLREIAVGLSAFNLFDAKYYDSEFTYSANWDPGQSARLVPERYVTVGTPRTVLGTLTLYLN
jgi:outer membrane receptor protein involved in Fe transport